MFARSSPAVQVLVLRLATRARPLSTTAPTARPFVLWAPDYTDSNALERRTAVRPRHMVAANRLIENGIIKVAGGLDSAEPGSPKPKLIGSMIIYDVPTLADARALVESDIYYTEGVWDKENLTIYPLLPATTIPDRAGVTQPQPAGSKS